MEADDPTQPPDADEDERAARAVRTALAARAAAHEPVALAAHDVLDRRRWRGPLVIIGAAAAVLVIIAGGFVAAALTSHHDSLPAGHLPAPASGWQWTTWDDVALEVPADWGYRFPTTTCDTERDAPYIQWAVSVGIPAVLCGGTAHSQNAPEPFPIGVPGDWQAKAGIISANSPAADSYTDGVTTYAQWQLAVRSVGDRKVFVLTDPAHRHLADRILDSARTFTVDANGCSFTSPVIADHVVLPDPAFDLQDVTVRSMAVCQYGRTDPGRGLEGSLTLDTDTTRRLVSALQAAPTAGYGADPNSQCAGESPSSGDIALVLRLQTDSGTRELHAYFNTCTESGYYDGTHRYQLTHATCSPIFVHPPLLLEGFTQALAPTCIP